MYVLSFSGLRGNLGVTEEERKEMNDLFALENKVSASFPKCAGIDCNAAASKMRQPGVYPWLPLGVVHVFGTSPEVGLSFLASDFVDANGNLKVRIERDIDKALIGSKTLARVIDKWLSLSKAKFQETAPGNGNLTVKEFVKKYPEFTIDKTYRTVKFSDSSKLPTSSELNNKNGMASFYNRGGYLIYKPLIEARAKLLDSTGGRLRFCAQWCNGCITLTYPYGVPTCADIVDVSDSSSNWNFYAGIYPDGKTIKIVLERGKDSSWEKFWSKIDSKLNKIYDGICNNRGKLVAAASSSGNAAGTASAVYFSKILEKGCRVVPLPITVAPPVVSPPISPFVPSPFQPQPIKWYKTTKGQLAIAGGIGVAALGLLSAFFNK